MKLIAWIAVSLIGLQTQAHVGDFGTHPFPVLAELQYLKGLGIPILMADEVSQIGYAYLTPEAAQMISEVSHEFGKCGPFYTLPDDISASTSSVREKMDQIRANVLAMRAKQLSFLQIDLDRNPQIESAIRQVSVQNLRAWVEKLSSFPSRAAREQTRNNHVVELQTKLQQMLASTPLRATVELVQHRTTPQNSLVVRIPGSSRADEIIVLGAHLDSIVSNIFGGNRSPGADDNASGSSNLIETLRIFANHGQPQRTVEIYFYAAEEIGLVGSGEVARTYKAEAKDVVSVMQLDMTAFAGLGPNNIGNINDFTHPWLQAYMRGIVETYLPEVTVHDFKCGYGCSDHASWFNEGFPAFAPFEATMNTHNKLIHTKNDVIGSVLNFDHSAIFSKIALVYLMDMSNSDKRVQ